MKGKQYPGYPSLLFVLSVCGFCILLLFTSCTSGNRVDGYIYYRLAANPTTLDPALIVDVTGGSLSAKLFNGLVRLRDDLSIRPDIAEKWKVSIDGKKYTFWLKKGILFSNGREVKAQDFRYSFQRILAPEGRSPNTWVFEKILGAEQYMKGKSKTVEGIKVVDEYILEITLKTPFSPFLSLLTMTAAYVVPEEEVEKWGPDFSSHPVGTGPYVLKEWLPNREIILLKRKGYFDSPALVRGIIYRIIPEDLTAITEFEIGNIDVITIPASEYSRYRRDPKWQPMISSILGLNTYYLGLNCSKAPFSNVNFRKAVSYAIDRGKILRTLYENRGRTAYGPVPDIMRLWEVPSGYQYNPERARGLIRKEGLSNVSLNLTITADQEVVDIAEVIQSYLKEAGISVKIKQLEWSAYKEAVNKGEPDMFYLSWWADYPDPENFLFPLFHSSNHGPAGNRTRYTNHTVDSLIEKGQHSLDSKTSAIYYSKAEEIIVDEAPWVPFWHRTDFTVRQPWIRNYKIYPIYSMDKGTELSL